MNVLKPVFVSTFTAALALMPVPAHSQPAQLLANMPPRPILPTQPPPGRVQYLSPAEVAAHNAILQKLKTGPAKPVKGLSFVASDHWGGYAYSNTNPNTVSAVFSSFKIPTITMPQNGECYDPVNGDWYMRGSASTVGKPVPWSRRGYTSNAIPIRTRSHI